MLGGITFCDIVVVVVEFLPDGTHLPDKYIVLAQEILLVLLQRILCRDILRPFDSKFTHILLNGFSRAHPRIPARPELFVRLLDGLTCAIQFVFTHGQRNKVIFRLCRPGIVSVKHFPAV